MAKFNLAPSSMSKLADKIRNAIGAGDYGKVLVQTPQFKRTDDNEPWYFPETEEEFRNIEKAPHDLLINMGLGVWERNDKGTHYLYPGEWYEYIPNGMEVTDIFGNTEIFKNGVTDDDIRFGCLPYGFIKKEEN